MAGLIANFGREVFASIVGNKLTPAPELPSGASMTDLASWAALMLQHMDESLQVIAESVRPPNDLQPGVVEFTTVIQPDPAGGVFDRGSKPHISLYCVATFPLIIDTPGVGKRTATTVAGWNQLEIRQGTSLSVANGSTPVNVIIRCGDVPLGTLI